MVTPGLSYLTVSQFALKIRVLLLQGKQSLTTGSGAKPGMVLAPLRHLLAVTTQCMNDMAELARGVNAKVQISLLHLMSITSFCKHNYLSCKHLETGSQRDYLLITHQAANK